MQLRYSAGEAAKQLWQILPGLLLHQHLWIRKLAADLLGQGFVDPGVCEILYALPFILSSCLLDYCWVTS